MCIFPTTKNELPGIKFTIMQVASCECRNELNMKFLCCMYIYIYIVTEDFFFLFCNCHYGYFCYHLTTFLLVWQPRSCHDRSRVGNGSVGLDSLPSLRHLQSKDGFNGERPSIANLHEQGTTKEFFCSYYYNCKAAILFCDSPFTNFSVGMHKILSLLESDDPNVRIHAVKVVANLAAEGIYDAIYSYYSLL